MENKTILCVDDDPFFGELYRAVLEPKGYAVEWAQNAGEGYEAWKRVKPDLVLLDVMMPEMAGFRDGFDLLEKIRREGDGTQTPIIMISAIGGSDDIRHGLDLGATAYLAKQDMVPETLLQEIEKHLGT